MSKEGHDDIKRGNSEERRDVQLVQRTPDETREMRRVGGERERGRD